LRKSYYDQLVAVNPAVFSDLAEDKTMILQSRLQRLDVLAQQYGANVQIGQQGGKTAVQAGLGTEMQGPGAQAGRGAIGAEMAPTE